MLETLDYTIRIGSTPPFLFRFVSKLHLYSTYAAHYAVYFYLDIHGIKLIFYFLNFVGRQDGVHRA